MEPIRGLVLRTALLASQTETVGEFPGNRVEKYSQAMFKTAREMMPQHEELRTFFRRPDTVARSQSKQ
jgi:hypothetical protein